MSVSPRGPHLMTVGDTQRPLGAYLERPGDAVTDPGTPVDLTGRTAMFRMVSDVDRSVKVDDAVADIGDQALVPGYVQYQWKMADVDTPGRYWGWFITDEGGRRETFPAGGDVFEIIIKDTA